MKRGLTKNQVLWSRVVASIILLCILIDPLGLYLVKCFASVLYAVVFLLIGDFKEKS